MHLDYAVKRHSIYCRKRVKIKVDGIAIKIVQIKQEITFAVLGNCVKQSDFPANLRIEW